MATKGHRRRRKKKAKEKQQGRGEEMRKAEIMEILHKWIWKKTMENEEMTRGTDHGQHHWRQKRRTRD